MQKDEEEREQQMLKEQIERAAKEAEERGITEQQASELKRDDEQQKIKLNLSLKAPAKPATAATPKLSGSNKMKMMMKSSSSGGVKKTETPKHIAALHK